MYKYTVACNNIESDAWDVMPIVMRANDFCKHCEIRCSHGKEIIRLNDSR